MSPWICYECGNPFDRDDIVWLDDDEPRCHDCAENEIALAAIEQRERRLDDPMRGQR